MKKIKGYKIMNPDMTCRGVKFKIGETYNHKGKIGLCEEGFHFCLKAVDCFNYYSFNNSIVCEVETLATSKIIIGDDKIVTDKIKIIKQIKRSDVLELVNSGNNNSGYGNSGNNNSGYGNLGNKNSGNSNSGDGNLGNNNSGNVNSGNSNSGDWNSSNYSSGLFNSKEQKVSLFNGAAYVLMGEFKFTDNYNALFYTSLKSKEWICESDMTEKEKKENPKYIITQGYLKTREYKEACKLWWEETPNKQKKLIQEIDGFNKVIFKEITGIEL